MHRGILIFFSNLYLLLLTIPLQGTWRFYFNSTLCIWTVVLEKTLESPLDCKDTQPVHLKGNQSRIFTRRADAEAETLILWPADVKNQPTGKDPDAGKDWRQKEKRVADDEMVSISYSMDMKLSKLWEIVKDREAWHTVVHGVAKSRTWLSDWTELNCVYMQ